MEKLKIILLVSPLLFIFLLLLYIWSASCCIDYYELIGEPIGKAVRNYLDSLDSSSEAIAERKLSAELQARWDEERAKDVAYQEFKAKKKRLLAGEAVDLEGRGDLTTLHTNFWGVQTYQKIYPSGSVGYKKVTYPNGSMEHYSDTNWDGKIDKITKKIERHFYCIVIWKIDRNHDGYFEEQAISRYNRITSIIETEVTKDYQGNGSFILIETRTVEGGWHGTLVKHWKLDE